jgi:hypothetical protein
VTLLLEHEGYDLDPVLILSIIAAESGGDPHAVSPAGACGPMQVIWKPWYQFTQSDICTSSYANLIQGMRILSAAIDIAREKGLDLEYALAFYNCSEEKVMADDCGPRGGLQYAEEVLNFWYPRVQEALEE